VIYKTDLLLEEDQIVARDMLLEQLQWDGPVFEVSAVTGAGTEELGQAIMQELERLSEELE
jgi:GTP-binding protein